MPLPAKTHAARNENKTGLRDVAGLVFMLQVSVIFTGIRAARIRARQPSAAAGQQCRCVRERARPPGRVC